MFLNGRTAIDALSADVDQASADLDGALECGTAAAAGQSSADHSTRNARTGRAMFFRLRSPSGWRVALSLPWTASRTARDTMIPPGGASASRRAATFTSSP